MKKCKLRLIVLSVCAGILITSAPALSQGKNQPSKAETTALEYLLPFAQKGLVIPSKIEPRDEEGLVYIEPLLWKNMTHVEKYRLMQGIMAFYDTHNTLKGSAIKGATLIDMTNKDILGFINLESRKITVKK